MLFSILPAAPANVQVSLRQMEVMEGDPLPTNTIMCSGESNPRGYYHWVRGSNSDIIAYGSRLSFNHSSSRISREFNDTYTCVVTNKHGTSMAHFVLSVLCK